MRLWIRRLLAGAVLALALPAHAESPLAQKIADSGKVVIGIANEAPYGFTAADGTVTGEAPEIAKHVLSEMGVKEVEGVITEFGSLIPGLNAGRFDMIAAGMFLTPERCQQITFSEPTYGIGQAFLIKEGNPKNIHNYDDVAANSDVTLAVMGGAIEGQYAQQAGVPMGQLLVVPDRAAGTAAVEAGRADAFALTSLTIGDIVEARGAGSGLAKTDAFSMVAGQNVKGHGGFGFRNEDAEFVDQFNEKLTAFIGTPEHLALVEPFGFTKDELPELTRDELCPGVYD
jgi:polar amino acid transport system substrate-binding protein